MIKWTELNTIDVKNLWKNSLTLDLSRKTEISESENRCVI